MELDPVLASAGSIRLDHADGSVEVASAGDVYHWPAGHTAYTEEGATFLEVGPVGPMREFHDHAVAALA
ncbi:MAG TPA: hypothetical protein VGE14_10390 [Marmoricola sp.]